MILGHFYVYLRKLFNGKIISLLCLKIYVCCTRSHCLKGIFAIYELKYGQVSFGKGEDIIFLHTFEECFFIFFKDLLRT